MDNAGITPEELNLLLSRHPNESLLKKTSTTLLAWVPRSKQHKKRKRWFGLFR